MTRLPFMMLLTTPSVAEKLDRPGHDKRIRHLHARYSTSNMRPLSRAPETIVALRTRKFDESRCNQWRWRSGLTAGGKATGSVQAANVLLQHELNAPYVADVRPRLVMASALQRPLMADIIEIPESCRNGARQRPRKVTPGDNGELRSDPPGAQIRPRFCPSSANSGQFGPSVRQLWPAFTQLGQQAANFWPTLVNRWAKSAMCFRTWADTWLPEQVFGNCGQLLDNFGACQSGRG